MTAVRIDGKALAEKVRAQVAEDVRAYGEPVCLATILVGDDPASHVYVGPEHQASPGAGIGARGVAELRGHGAHASSPQGEQAHDGDEPCWSDGSKRGPRRHRWVGMVLVAAGRRGARAP
ncbi:hypothetical protein B4Q13_16635 [Lacticaseibacillus rhamnosus]